MGINGRTRFGNPMFAFSSAIHGNLAVHQATEPLLGLQLDETFEINNNKGLDIHGENSIGDMAAWRIYPADAA